MREISKSFVRSLEEFTARKKKSTDAVTNLKTINSVLELGPGSSDPAYNTSHFLPEKITVLLIYGLPAKILFCPRLRA